MVFFSLLLIIIVFTYSLYLDISSVTLYRKIICFLLSSHATLIINQYGLLLIYNIIKQSQSSITSMHDKHKNPPPPSHISLFY